MDLKLHKDRDGINIFPMPGQLSALLWAILFFAVKLTEY